MDDQERRRIALDQLSRILAFFPRLDGKVSVIFAVDTALLATAALNFCAEDLGSWFVTVPAGLTLFGLVCSFCFCYRAAFPHLEGGNGSLLYFQQIAQRTETVFLDEFFNLDEQALTKDALCQVWKNAEILKRKFSNIKMAFGATGLSLAPWVILIIVEAMLHPQTALFH